MAGSNGRFHQSENVYGHTTPLLTHTYDLKDSEAAYELFENRKGG